MNRLPQTVTIGTLGELLVQLRLLEYGVQAAAPLKDSGNDLVALNGRCVKTIQVKTTAAGDNSFGISELPELYDLVALVQLHRDDENNLALDSSPIFLVPEECCKGNTTLNVRNLADFALTPEWVKTLFQ